MCAKKARIDSTIGRLRTPVREAFLYGIRHISFWFNEVWPYASLNHNEICRISYENASRTGVSNLPILLRATHPEEQIGEETAEKWKNGRKYRRMRKKLGNVPFCPPEVESLAAPMAPTQVSPIALGVQVYLFNRINDFSFSPKNKTKQKQTKQKQTKHGISQHHKTVSLMFLL